MKKIDKNKIVSGIIFIVVTTLFFSQVILRENSFAQSISSFQNKSDEMKRNSPLVCDFVQYCSTPKEYASKVTNNMSSKNINNASTTTNNNTGRFDISSNVSDLSNKALMYDKIKENDISPTIDPLNTDVTSNISLIIKPDIPEIGNQESSTLDMIPQKNASTEMAIRPINITTNAMNNGSNIGQNTFENLTTPQKIININKTEIKNPTNQSISTLENNSKISFENKSTEIIKPNLSNNQSVVKPLSPISINGSSNLLQNESLANESNAIIKSNMNNATQQPSPSNNAQSQSSTQKDNTGSNNGPLGIFNPLIESFQKLFGIK